jgi:HEAT repeat protein
MSFDPRIFQFLKSDDPEERKKGVKALARTGDREALRYLATIYKEDPEPDVRDLALKAGQHIKNAGTRDEWSGTGDFKATAEMAIPKAVIPDSDVKTSKKMMEQALDLAMKEEFEKAEVLVRKAFALNSNLQYESYFTGIASDVMGIELEKVVDELLNKGTE